MERLTQRFDSGNVGFCGNGTPTENAMQLPKIMSRLCSYEDTGLEPEEITAAITSAAKLISTMRNNKKAALWLRKYGEGV